MVIWNLELEFGIRDLEVEVEVTKGEKSVKVMRVRINTRVGKRVSMSTKMEMEIEMEMVIVIVIVIMMEIVMEIWMVLGDNDG